MSLLSRLVNVSVKVPEEVRRLMKRVNVNWGEYLRQVIEAKIREELTKRLLKNWMRFVGDLMKYLRRRL